MCYCLYEKLPSTVVVVSLHDEFKIISNKVVVLVVDNKSATNVVKNSRCTWKGAFNLHHF